MKKKIIISLLALLVVLIGIIGGGSAYMLHFSLQPKLRTYTYDWKYNLHKSPYLRQWFDSIGSWRNLPDTTIRLSNGLRQHAFYLRHPNSHGHTAILIHGYGRTAVYMLVYANIYYRQMGYDILMPDLHGHGQSEGDGAQMGWKDREDIEQWIPVVEKKFGARDIVVHGVSMGAATTMMMSGDPLPRSVKCFVDDCGYTSVWDEFSYELDSEFGLPPFPLMYSTSALCRLTRGWSFGKASALKQVARCRRPMLFIHGDRDRFVPTWMVYPLHQAKSGSKALWVTRGCRHTESIRRYPAEYSRRIHAFVGQAMR